MIYTKKKSNNKIENGNKAVRLMCGKAIDQSKKADIQHCGFGHKA